MVTLGLAYALLSGICNGLFTAPMKLITRWKWENIWLVFILTSCLAMPFAVVSATLPDYALLLSQAPRGALTAALSCGFAWGFGAILFGLSVDQLGVSVANSLVIGLSSALGSVVPLILGGAFRLEARQLVLFLGVATFIAGVSLCGLAGRMRDKQADPAAGQRASGTGYLFATGAGVMSAVFNVGYSLALPIRDTGERFGHPGFLATNCIWLLMLAAGSIPNIAYCALRLRKHSSGGLFFRGRPQRAWALSVLMGLLWGGSIFLYGAATPLLGDIGPSIGWPLSLAVALLVANLMGLLLGEWRAAPRGAIRRMRVGILVLLAAIALCAVSTGVDA
ncbi:MAG: L-rhamnose/proton symporter RhaT [Acidobacteriota bacterium]